MDMILRGIKEGALIQCAGFSDHSGRVLSEDQWKELDTGSWVVGRSNDVGIFGYSSPKNKFAQVVKEEGIYRFKEGQPLSTRLSDLPFFIGQGLAQEGLESKCLVLKDSYSVKVTKTKGGWTELSFHRK
jgi:hypothetical protein